MKGTNHAEINLDILRGNYALLKARAPHSHVMCVVKADAYGHGAPQCTAALRDAGADWFGVATLGEAMEIRRAASEANILILGYTPPEDAAVLIANNITQTVFSQEYAQALSAQIVGNTPLKAHIKLDTGMNRLGFHAGEEGVEELVGIHSLPNLRYTGIFTHFACSDEPANPMTRLQFARYTDTVNALRDRGVEFELHHVCNSAAAVNAPDMSLEMVRCGIVLYGLRPSPETDTAGCRPVMSLYTTVSHVHTMRRGESVSYGAVFTAERDTRLATLSIGYADGFLRAYTGGLVYFGENAAPIVGRICMDQCMADITELPCAAAAGDTVEIFGPHQSADRFAALAGTINYETVCCVGKRVPRVYIREQPL